MKFLIAGIPLAAGFLLDMIFGDPHFMPHPVRLIGRLISALEKLTRKLFPRRLTLGGAMLGITVLLLSSAVPAFILLLCYRLNLWLGVAAESVMCYYLIAAKCLKKESMKVYKALEKNDVEAARKAVSMIVGRDTERLDRKGIIRAAVETVSENTSDGVTAPIIFIALGGASLGFFYKAANTMDSMLGYKNEKYQKIGYFSAKIDDFLNFLPSRITAIFMIFSAKMLNFDSKNAFRIWRRDRRKHASPNSAQTESVCAGALDVRLAGDAYYFGELHEKPFIGDALREIENEDVRRANRLMYCAATITLALFTALRVIIFGVLL